MYGFNSFNIVFSGVLILDWELFRVWYKISGYINLLNIQTNKINLITFKFQQPVFCDFLVYKV